MTIQSAANLKFNIVKRKTKKTQILLCNTLRPYGVYLNSLKLRINNTYDKIPHFIITKKGEVIPLFSTDYYSHFIENKSSIVICLENLGWLQKNNLAPMYQNWIGDVYRGEPVINRWKERFFWDPYTKEQIHSLKDLTNQLMDKHQIEKRVINHCAPIDNPNKFKGILSRCNYSNIFSDVSPALSSGDLESLIK